MDANDLARIVCPGMVHCQVRYKQLLQQLLRPGIHWLDLGCGHETVRSWALLPGEDERSFTRAPALSVGIDRDAASLRNNRCIPCRVVGDIQSLPFADASFDVVTANMVLEHVEDPSALLAEVGRVLRPKGMFAFHTPNKYYPTSLLVSVIPRKIKPWVAARLTHRNERDVYPTLYRMNTQSAIVHYCAAAGFQIQSLEMVETLTYPLNRILFLSYLAQAWLLRRKFLRRFQADFLGILVKPEAAPESSQTRGDTTHIGYGSTALV